MIKPVKYDKYGSSIELKRLMTKGNMDNDTYDDRTNIKFLKQNEVNELQVTINRNIVKRLEELEDFKTKALIRLDQEIENRTKAFERIEELQDKLDLIDRYGTKDTSVRDSLSTLRYDIETKLERIDDILVVHRNQDRTQKKNYKALRDVWDKTVLKIIEKGEHGKE